LVRLRVRVDEIAIISKTSGMPKKTLQLLILSLAMSALATAPAALSQVKQALAETSSTEVRKASAGTARATEAGSTAIVKTPTGTKPVTDASSTTVIKTPAGTKPATEASSTTIIKTATGTSPPVEANSTVNKTSTGNSHGVETNKASEANAPGRTVTPTDTARTGTGMVLVVPDGWQLFVSPGQDFRILLPAKVKRTANDKLGRIAMMYFQRDANGIDYLITDGVYLNPARKAEEQEVYFQDALKTIEKQLHEKTPEFVNEVSDVTGIGWHGKQVSFKHDDSVLATIRVAFSNNDDVAYKMLANNGHDIANVRTFFDSFEVNPIVASRAHPDPKATIAKSNDEHEKPSAINNFVQVIWTISAVMLAIVLVSLVASKLRHRKNEKK
jgi:hypothetical protein